jgi:stage V sporulation protein G
MEVTDVKIYPVDEDKLKAYVSVVFDNCFVVTDIKIINGNSGRFLSMPSKRRRNGTFKDVAHPLNPETRRYLEEAIFREYDATLARRGGQPARGGQQEREAREDQTEAPTGSQQIAAAGEAGSSEAGSEQGVRQEEV